MTYNSLTLRALYSLTSGTRKRKGSPVVTSPGGICPGAISPGAAPTSAIGVGVEASECVVGVADGVIVEAVVVVAVVASAPKCVSVSFLMAFSDSFSLLFVGDPRLVVVGVVFAANFVVIGVIVVRGGIGGTDILFSSDPAGSLLVAAFSSFTTLSVSSLSVPGTDSEDDEV